MHASLTDDNNKSIIITTTITYLHSTIGINGGLQRTEQNRSLTQQGGGIRKGKP